MAPSHAQRFGPEARFGPYEILDRIGAGGMGEVYRARDTRLDRTVAIKVLSPTASGERKARARFEREARAISSLSHPHICAVYDVGHEAGVDYIVMEYLQGESLATRLDRRGLKLDQAFQYAVQIASALAEAHRAGIVHRDLKPGNVMLTPSGAKLLDFGLAKQEPAESGAIGPTPDTVTVEGQLVGTLPYMSPEQVEGKEADPRSDVFAFGSMLHEMITHHRAFDGSHVHLIAAILSKEPPPPSSFQPQCPPALDHLVARCLAKDPNERWQSAQDLLLELKWAVAQAPPVESPRRRAWRVLGWAAVAVAGAVVVGLLARRTRETALPAASPRRVTIAPGWESAPALSQDGGLIAYASNESGNADVWIVDARGGNAIRLTDDPASDTDPAWYPDGGALAFTSDRDGTSAIWKVLRFGGAASMLVPNAVDAAISPDGTQVAFARASPSGMRRIWIAPLGDTSRPTMLTTDDGGLWDHGNPAFSPDGKTVCYQAQRDLWLVPSAGGPARRLTRDDERDVEPVWSPDGRHVYFASLRGGGWALWRVSASGGPPVRVTHGTGGERHPSLSRDGRRLTFATYGATPDLTLLDLPTRREAALTGLGAFIPSWAPDGTSLVFSSARFGGRYDLWVQPTTDLRAAGPPRRLTDQAGSAANPTFSADGRWIAYYRVLSGQRDIWTIPASGGTSVQFTDDPAADIHPAWSPDGTRLAFSSERSGSARIWVAPVEEGRPAGPPRMLTSGESDDQAPAWSPDGEWIAFVRGTEALSDVWVVDAAGEGPPRMLATGSRAGRVAWEPGARTLLVSGQWGRGVGLKRYSFLNGREIPLDRPLSLGQNPVLIDFTLSRDGRVIAFSRDELRGDIWTLEPLDRAY